MWLVNGIITHVFVCTLLKTLCITCVGFVCTFWFSLVLGNTTILSLPCNIRGTQYLIFQALSILYMPYILEYYHN